MSRARSDHVWSTDITSGRRSQGLVYLVAMRDGQSRAVLSGEVAVTVDRHGGAAALERALIRTPPDSFNADPGAQFTSLAWTEPWLARGRLLSLDGRGRVFDHIVVERRWRRVKQEAVDLQDSRRGPDAIQGLWRSFALYHRERFHPSLNDHTPATVDRQGQHRAAFATFN